MSSDTGVKVKAWLVPELHDHCTSCSPLVPAPFGMSAQLLLAWLTMVLTNAVAAFAGTTMVSMARPAAAARARRLECLMESSGQNRKPPYGPVRIAFFWLSLKCVFG